MVCINRGIYGFWGPSWVLTTMPPRNTAEIVDPMRNFASKSYEMYHEKNVFFFRQENLFLARDHTQMIPVSICGIRAWVEGKMPQRFSLPQLA